jgi:ACS family hexuronate transporter-like MFS transporter
MEYVTSLVIPKQDLPVSGREQVASWRWRACVMLMAATALSYLDRQSLSIVAPVIRNELRLDNAELGFLLAAFFWAYSVMHVGAGWFLDRWNSRWTFGAFVGLWSASQMLAGASSGLWTLAASRFALGSFEAGGQIGAARIIARMMPKRDRALANGLMMSGGSIGAMIAPVLVIWLANSLGWRLAFVAIGAIGVVWTTIWITWFRPGASVLYGPRVDGVRVLSSADRWPVILRNPKFWASTAAAAFGVPILHVSSSWVPTYFVQHWGLPISAGLGLYLFIIYMGLDLGFLGQGALVRWLVGRGWGLNRARKTVLVAAGVLMLSAALIPLAPTVSRAILLVFLLNMGRAAWGALFLSFNQELAPARVAMIAGIMGAIGAFSGAVVIWTIGVLSGRFGFGPAFGLVGLLALLGLLPLLLVRWDGEPDGPLPPSGLDTRMAS